MRTCVWLSAIISKAKRWNNERRWKFALNWSNQPIKFKLLHQVYDNEEMSHMRCFDRHKLFKDAWKSIEDSERIFSVIRNIALCNILNGTSASKIKEHFLKIMNNIALWAYSLRLPFSFKCYSHITEAHLPHETLRTTHFFSFISLSKQIQNLKA